MKLNAEDYERLVEQLTDLVLERLDEESNRPSFCSTDVKRIVDAGASRIGIVLGETATARDWASLIDHTLLKPEATEDEIRRLCVEAIEYGFASVCVNPFWVKRATEFLKGSKIPVCTVIGFPLGATPSDVKAYETRRVIFDGAKEVDMVINIGALKSGDNCTVEEDIRAVVKVAHEHEVLCKVIIETALLTDDEKIKACIAAKNAGADFVKTSTGFAKGGATVHDVALMRRVVRNELGIKASGGVKSLEDARKMIKAGATRIGASAGVKITKEAEIGKLEQPNSEKEYY
ncbi:MAG: deoxyribose-phosphate aldolase [Pyrinomonadaceae bacterium]|nr:deoxyribose-phosphate aldolase [Pyrinomonadaceae bacterium]MCX7639924.1 deoxyribose-phosphate aldolase [Pyrinomonadaceae bacterium]MDW8304096.1 deoxyribose-phosphate aldolase [Acidobacteriota bacterium]